MLGPSFAVRLDALFTVNFLFDLLLFWFACSISWAKPRWWRVLLVAVVGAALSFLPVLVSWGIWLTSGPVVIGISMLMALLLAWPCSFRQLLVVFGGLWVITGAAGGAGFLLAERFQLDLGEGAPATLAGAGLAIALIGVQVVWRTYRERQVVKEALYQFRICLGGQILVLTGLVDSGNSLRTPLFRRPVAVVEAECLRACLPPEVMESLSMGWDALEAIPENWQNRCQIIPYTAVGNREAALVAVMPDEMALWDQGRWVTVDGVVGLALQPLDPKGQYQALLSPAMLQELEAK